MIYRLKDGDTLKIIPIVRKDGKFDLCKVVNCAFLDNKMIYDLDESKGYLRKMCYSHRKNNARNVIQMNKRHFFCVYVDGEVKFISVGAKLMDIITGYDGFDISDDKHLLVNIKMLSAGTNMVLPCYDESKIINKEWIKPVLDRNQEEWLEWIKNNQPGYLEDFLERSSLMNNIPSVKKAFGSDLLSDIIVEDRDRKINQIIEK